MKPFITKHSALHFDDLEENGFTTLSEKENKFDSGFSPFPKRYRSRSTTFVKDKFHLIKHILDDNILDWSKLNRIAADIK